MSWRVRIETVAGRSHGSPKASLAAIKEKFKQTRESRKILNAESKVLSFDVGC